MLYEQIKALRARYTKQGQLDIERNSIKALKILHVIYWQYTYYIHSEIISTVTISIYQEQCKLPPVLRHAFFSVK